MNIDVEQHRLISQQLKLNADFRSRGRFCGTAFNDFDRNHNWFLAIGGFGELFVATPFGNFENAWQNKNKIDFDGLNTYSLSLDDLIINKSSTQRAKDKLDLEQLKELSKISK